MAEFTIRVDGLAELERAWINLASDLGPAKARRVVNKPMRAAIEPIRRTISVTTPIDTGDLAESTFANTNIVSRRELRSTFFTRNDVAAARAGWGWRFPSDLIFRALATEYGTRFQPAQRILQNALLSNSQTALNILRAQLGPAIESRAAAYRRTGA